MRRLSILLLLMSLVTAGLGPAVAAQTDQIDETREEREAKRSEKAEAAARLDPLFAQDAELEQAVADLDLNVATQVAKLDAIQQSLAAAEAEVVAAEERVAVAQADIAALKDLARRQAVEAYVRPTSEIFEQVLSSEDLTEASRRRAMLRSVSTSQADVLDHMRAAEDDLRLAIETAEAAVQTVLDRRAEEEGQLRELEDARADQLRLRQALAERIAEFQAEVDALAAEEADLTTRLQNLIVVEDARARAQAEAERRAEEAKRLAELAKVPDTDDDTTVNQVTDDNPVETLPPLEAPPTSGGAIWPINGIVTSFFGPRWGRMHNGIDINGNTGSPVAAMLGGTVISAGDDGGYGLTVIIDHGGGFASVYAHLSVVNVSSGSSVGQGATIGAVGCTGSCTGPHLHLETRVTGIAQDPLLYLP